MAQLETLFKNIKILIKYIGGKKHMNIHYENTAKLTLLVAFPASIPDFPPPPKFPDFSFRFLSLIYLLQYSKPKLISL